MVERLQVARLIVSKFDGGEIDGGNVDLNNFYCVKDDAEKVFKIWHVVTS